MSGRPEIEQAAPDETLPGQDRPPSRWPVRIGAVALLAAAAVGVVSLAHALDDGDFTALPAPSTGATRTATPSTTPSAMPSSDDPVISPSLTVPAAARAAIRAAFPGARTAVVSSIVVRNRLVSRHYGARTTRSTVDIEIDADRTAPDAAVLRTPTSVQLIQQIVGNRVSVTVTAARGATTQQDFRAVQQLIGDPRLLATG